MSRSPILSGSAIGPAGFGAWKVPSRCQRSCQRLSISAAIAAVYRNGGASSGRLGAGPVVVSVLIAVPIVGIACYLPARPETQDPSRLVRA